jgi:hypothetical protein
LVSASIYLEALESNDIHEHFQWTWIGAGDALRSPRIT